MIDQKSERIVGRAAGEVRDLFRERLVCVALYGSGAGADFVPGRSDLNLVVVLDTVVPDDLTRLRPLVPLWQRQGLATPLVLDRAFIERSADVFPIELSDLQAQHRVLFGEDVFSAVVVSAEHLRQQCEHEARSKSLRLRELYLEIGADDRDLRALVLESLKTFVILMRALNRLSPAGGGGSWEETLKTFAATHGCRLPTMHSLLEVRLGKAPWSGDAETVFRSYFQEVQRVVAVLDRCLHPSAAET